MDDMCEKIRQQIPELIGEGLSAEKAVELEQHRNQCPACNEYFEALQADDKLLCEFAQAMQPSVARLENIAIDELGRRRWDKTAGQISLCRQIIRSRTARIAAVFTVAAILIGAAILSDPDEVPVGIANQQNGPGGKSLDLPAEDKPDVDAVLAAEMGEIREMFAASDVPGLVVMLSVGQPQTRLAAANYLAQIGDVQTLGALEQLSADWQGDAADNPFAHAAAQIMARLAQQRQRSEPNDQEREILVAETTVTESEEGIGCKGVVVDVQGRAIGGARVLLYYNRSRWGLGNRILEETVSAADGTFVCREMLELGSVRPPSHTQEAYILAASLPDYVLMATHPDYAFGWRNIRQVSGQDAYRIVLTRSISRTLTVIDNDGNRLVGARIWLSSAGDGDSREAAFRDYLNLPADVGLVTGVTDAEGRVVMTNLPRTHCVLRATLEGYADGYYISARGSIRLSKGASISGWVLAEGNKPVVGATISFAPSGRYRYFLTVTDDEGHFHIEDLPAQGWDSRPWDGSEGFSGSYTVNIKHERCAAEPVDVTLLPGQSIDDFVVEASSDTTLVECRVVEFGTNVPVAGARIHGWNRIGKFSGYSNSDGVFAVRVLPGLVQLSFRSLPGGIYILDEQGPAISKLGFDAIGEKVTVTLETPPIAGFLRSVSGIVLGLDGEAQHEGETKVYAGAARFQTSIVSGGIRPVWVDSDGRFELKGVPAGRKLHLYAATKDHTIAGTNIFEIPDDPNWSSYLAMNLEATQSASVLVTDDDANIVADRHFRIDPIVEGERVRFVDRRGRTDENGLLELDGIVPGLEYYLRTVEPLSSKEPSLEPMGPSLTLKMILVPLEP